MTETAICNVRRQSGLYLLLFCVFLFVVSFQVLLCSIPPHPPLHVSCCFCFFAGGRRQPGCGRAFGEVTPAHSRRLWSGGGDGVPHHYWSRYQRKSPITCCVPGGISDEQLPLFSHQWFAFRQDLARCFTKFHQSFSNFCIFYQHLFLKVASQKR